MLMSNGMYLEPRLQEYIKKKKYYKENNIAPSIPLEVEFSITSSDVKQLKTIRTGRTDIYEPSQREKYFEPAEKPSFEFDPEQVYKQDIRFARFAKKQEKLKEAMKQRDAHGDFDDSFRPLTQFAQQHSLRPSPNPEPEEDLSWLDDRDPRMGTRPSKDLIDPETNQYIIKQRAKSERVYRHVEPKINYKDRIYQEVPGAGFSQTLPVKPNPDVSKIIGRLDSYENKINRTYQTKSSMDTDMKVVTPNPSSSNKKYINHSSYKSVPFMGRGEGIRDVNAECDLQNGSSTRAGKSFGYFNPVEHYFDYINGDIQDPAHVVSDRGTSTRQDNYGIAGQSNQSSQSKQRRQYTREIFN